MASSGGSAKRKSQKDKEMAAQMKKDGVERITGRCAVCYAIITRDTWKSKYRHVCWKEN